MQNSHLKIVITLIALFTILLLIVSFMFGYTPYPDSKGNIIIVIGSFSYLHTGLFTTLLLIKRRKTLWLSIAALACLIIYYNIPLNEQNFWLWQNALLAITFLYTGYLYHQYKDFIHTFNKPLYSSLLLLILIFIKVYEYHIDLPMQNIAIESAPLFLVDSFIWLLFVISIIRYIPHCKRIEWTGKHCIIYYFVCDGCPLLISMMLNKIDIPYNGYLFRYLFALILVYSFATVLTWFINRYVPFLLGK